MAPTSPPAIIVEGLVYFTNLNDTPSRPDDTHDEIDLELDLDLNEDHEVAPNEMEEEKPKRESMYVELFQGTHRIVVCGLLWSHVGTIRHAGYRAKRRGIPLLSIRT